MRVLGHVEECYDKDSVHLDKFSSLRGLVKDLIGENLCRGIRLTNRGYSGNSFRKTPSTRIKCTHGMDYGKSDLITLEPGSPMSQRQIAQAAKAQQQSTDWFRARAGRVTGTTAYRATGLANLIREVLNSIDIDVDMFVSQSSHDSTALYDTIYGVTRDSVPMISHLANL